MKKILYILTFISFFIYSFVYSESLKPDKQSKCPVCGMFVYKYKDFLAVMTLRNGDIFWFDGAKDFFKFYLNPKKYREDIEQNNFVKFFVTDYYSLKFVDAKKAYYVIGSDIYGPMGKELIPFEKYDDAKEFMKDHGGKKILKFSEVNDKILKEMN